MYLFDFHMHSHHSFDGEKTPKELIEIGKEIGLKYMALSDHNDMHGVDEMIRYGKEAGIEVIPAIEFCTLFSGLETDLLGYNFDYHKPYYTGLVDQINSNMKNAAQERLQLLSQTFHVDFTLDKVIETAGPKGNLYNTMMGFILADEANKNHPLLQDYLPGGSKSDMPVINFYWDYCSSGKPYYVHVKYPTMKETIDRIHQDGGIAVLAHPWKNFYQKEDLLLKAMEYGIDGIEAYSNYHSPEQNEYYEKFAKEHNLIITCGSDFHGYMKPHIQMGEFGYNKNGLEEILKNFLQAIHKNTHD